MPPEAITLADIQKARQRVTPCVRRTPQVISATLCEQFKTNVYCKLELFQKTGSFKVRGVFNKILSLPPEVRNTGLVAISGGNHGLAVAYAARALDLKGLVLMPESAPQHYIDAARGYGAEVDFAKSASEAFSQVEELERGGWHYLHPFDDPAIMAGQGTMGLEILEDTPQVTDVIVSIGGGGMMTGVATAIKTLKPAVRIWGVETEGADCMSQSLAAGEIMTLNGTTSVARALGAAAPSPMTFAAAKNLLQGVTVVSDDDALDAMHFILERMKLLTEPAAACTLAAADRLRGQFAPDRHVVLVLGGGNVSLDVLQSFDPD
ncbi:MAG: threonine/serine dehydratase [Acidobacteriota bacterium]